MKKNELKVVERIWSGKTIQDAWDDFTTDGIPDKDIIRLNIEWVESSWVVRATCKY